MLQNIYFFFMFFLEKELLIYIIIKKNMKVKEQFLETEVWVPYTNSNMQLRFVDKGLYNKLATLYPNFFEIETPKIEKVKANDLHIKDTITPNLHDSKAKSDRPND